MAVKTKAEIERLLTHAAEKTRKVREAAEALREASQMAEQESAQRTVNLIRSGLSPLVQRER